MSFSDDGWNQIQFNLADFTRRAYGTNYVETLRVQIHANCRIRRVYFSDRLYSEDELPAEFKLYLPVSSHLLKILRFHSSNRTFKLYRIINTYFRSNKSNSNNYSNSKAHSSRSINSLLEPHNSNKRKIISWAQLGVMAQYKI